MTPAPVRDFGPRPELAYLSVDLLFVDHTYQRTMESRRSLALIDRMIKAFRWSAFGTVLVAPTKSDGIRARYAVMDGQHRVTVARKLGIKEVPCIIISADSIAEQAAAFLAANQARVVVNAFALHHAMMVAGDPAAQRIHAACVEGGVEIPKYPIPANLLKPNQTLAIGAIKAIAEETSPREAGAALRVLRQAFPTDAGALRAYFITGIHAALSNGSLADILVRRLGAMTLHGFHRNVADRCHATGETRPVAVHRIVGDGRPLPALKAERVRHALVAKTAAVSPPRPAARPALPASGHKSIFEIPAGAGRAADAAAVERHIKENGITKCPSAHVAVSEHPRPAEYKTPADGLGPVERASKEKQANIRSKKDERIKKFMAGFQKS